MAKKKQSDSREMRGILYTHSEQGVDPFRAFQDERHIAPPDPETGGTSGAWSYEGMHMLKDGDTLTVLSKDCRRTLWRGTVHLRVQQEPQSHHRHNLKLFQVGVTDARWNRWFQEEFPAQLIPAATLASKTGRKS